MVGAVGWPPERWFMEDRESNSKAQVPHGLVAKAGRVSGTIALKTKGGASRQERERLINEQLAPELSKACDELGVVLATMPAAYTKERPGRDGQGRTVFEVHGRAEGDVLVPAISGRS